jgi:NDP-sugar pyrophosphorylase family protein
VQEGEVRGNVGSLTALEAVDGPILFAFADLLTNLRFAEIFEVHRAQDNAVTVASHRETHQLQLGELLVKGDAIVSYREKPTYDFLICSGIVVMEPQVIDLLPRSGSIGLSSLVSFAIEAGLKVSHWTHDAFWIDVNTPELLAVAERAEW